MISKWIQNSLLAVAMASSVNAWLVMAEFAIMDYEICTIPVIWIVLYILSLCIAEDVRNAFKKVLWFEKRKDKRPIWQVGIGMILFFAQVGFVETFARGWMEANLDGMPLYLIFSFMNAFLLTVIYEEIFYVEETRDSEQYKFKRLK